MAIYDKVLLTVDYDRTLTGPDGAVPQRNIEAIRYFTENGGAFTVNTGRCVNTFGSKMGSIPANVPFLLMNGSAWLEDGVLTNLKPIDLDMWTVLNRLAEEFPQMNLEVQGLSDNFLINEKPEYIDFYRAMGWHYTSAKPGDDLGPFLKCALFGKPKYSDLATMFEATEEELAEGDRIENRILELWGDKVVTFRAAPRIIDVHARGVSKLRSARDLQDKLGKEILVCVGDAENDITMLDGADYAYCPADAVVADRYETVGNCGDGAVADVIYEKIPEILKLQEKSKK